MAHFMQSGHGGCVTQLPYKESLNHPIFKHYNPSVGAWATGQLIQAWVPKLKVDIGFPVDGAESMPHASGMDMDVRRQQQADRDRMENDRQVYMHTLKREQDMLALQQQLADNGGDNYQNDDDDGQEQPPSRRRTAKKAVRRVVRFARDNGSDESSGEEDVDEGVEPVRNAKRTGGRKVRSPRNRLGDQLSSSTAKTSSSKKKSSPY